MRGAYPRAFCFYRGCVLSKILSAFFDEAGQERHYEPGAKWYLLTLVLHDQDDDISTHVAAYEE